MPATLASSAWSSRLIRAFSRSLGAVRGSPHGDTSFRYSITYSLARSIPMPMGPDQRIVWDPFGTREESERPRAQGRGRKQVVILQELTERAMGLEPTTSSLGSWHSTN